METQILQYLAAKPAGKSVGTKDLLKDLGLDLPLRALNEVLERMQAHGLVKLHKQSYSPGDPPYDLIVITQAGRDFLESPP